MKATIFALLALAAVGYALRTANGGTIITITDTDNPPCPEDPCNFMMTFPSNNASVATLKQAFEYYEDITAGAIDLIRGRYILMDEEEQILYYNISNLQQIKVLQLPETQIPDAMHYDQSKDLIWLVNVGFSDWNICSVTADGQQTCFGPWQGQYSYTADSSTLDADAGKLYVQLESMQSGQPLFIFDTVATQLSGPIQMIDLCQEMNVAVVGTQRLLTCVDFITNILVSVDTSSGKFSKLMQLSGTPQPYTSIIDNSVSGVATFYAEIVGLIGINRWEGYDVGSGRQLFNSTVDGNIQLELPMYIPPQAAARFGLA